MYKNNQNFKRRFLSAVMAAVMITGTGVGLSFSENSPASLSAAAAKDNNSTKDFQFTILDDGCIRITKYIGSSQKMTVPAYINGRKVTEIGTGSLDMDQRMIDNYEKKVTEVILPDTLKSINDYAFLNFWYLKKINIPSGVTNIGEYAFDHAPIDQIVIPASVTNIGSGAFHGGWTKKLYVYNSYVDLTTCGIRGTTTIYGFKGSSAEKYVEYVKNYSFGKSVKFSAIDVVLNKTQISLGKDETCKLTATVKNSELKDKTVKWRTSSSRILTVDQKGNVKAVGMGTAWITVKNSNGVEASCKITVKPAPSKVDLSKGIVTIGVGEKFSITSTVSSGSASAKRTYRTSNSSIVKMNKTEWTGEFVGMKPGVAYVTVRTFNGKEKACKVTVKPAPSSVKLNRSVMYMKVGQNSSLSAVIPNNTGSAARTFRTSNSSIVKMTSTNWTGKFKTVKKGTAWVTVRLYNGKEASCKIVVS